MHGIRLKVQGPVSIHQCLCCQVRTVHTSLTSPFQPAAILLSSHPINQTIDSHLCQSTLNHSCAHLCIYSLTLSQPAAVPADTLWMFDGCLFCWLASLYLFVPYFCYNLKTSTFSCLTRFVSCVQKSTQSLRTIL